LELVGGSIAPTPEQLAAIRKEYRLDKPFLEQYGTWAVHAAQLDLGSSLRTHEPVTGVIKSRLPTTLFLATFAMLIALTVGVSLGLLAGTRDGKVVDRAAVGFSSVAGTAPAFVTGLLLLYLFGVKLGWFPIFGAGSGFRGRLSHLTLPAIALAAIPLALIMRLTRASVVNVLRQDYILFATARGIRRRRILTRHVLRSSFVPIVTACALMFGHLLAGAVVVEYTFSLPGLGALLVESIEFKDIPTVQALVLLSATMVVFVNLLADLLAVASDPRIAIGGVQRD
jgi:peptide/nickel transport system permease protein